ncbi:MAG: GumN [Candidatus Solibacter sp.]|nr:GumN [Candidatus Solibacter sp.]
MAFISYHTRRDFALLAPLLLSTLLTAQTVAPTPAKKAMFWKVSSRDNVVYLLGSVHLGTKGMFPLAKEIEDAFDRSAVLAVEIDINRIDFKKMQIEVTKLGLYPEGDTLWNHIRPETRTALEQFCTAFGAPVERFTTMKPWLISMSAEMLPVLKNGMDPNLSVDRYFLDKAKEKKRIVEIESADAQYKLFAGFPDDVQEKILLDEMKVAGRAQDKAKRMENAWIAGDAAALDRIGAEDPTGPPEVQRAVLQDRNPRMADAAEQLLKSQEIGFVMVGAAHMAGKEGIVATLESRGYKVEQVTLKP